MSLANEFITVGTVRGGTLILGPNDALAMVAQARRCGIRILGVDGLWITEQTTQPDIGHSIDLGDDDSPWTAAEQFISARATTGLSFEVVLDE